VDGAEDVPGSARARAISPISDRSPLLDRFEARLVARQGTSGVISDRSALRDRSSGARDTPAGSGGIILPKREIRGVISRSVDGGGPVG
jgi:hypothetical protein